MLFQQFVSFVRRSFCTRANFQNVRRRVKVGFRDFFKVETLVRVTVDVFVLNISVIAAFFVRILWLHFFGGLRATAFYEGYLDRSVQAFINSLLPLSVTGIFVFYLSGFYTHGRTYRGRFKAAVIFEAVSITFLILGTLVGLLPQLFAFPGGTVVLAWCFAVVLGSALRLTFPLWRRLARSERKIVVVPVRNKIESVLVIGGAGYIGSHVVRQLLEKGYYVRVLDALFYGEQSIGELSGGPRFELIKGDFRNIEIVVKASRHMDAIIHLGGLVGDAACMVDEELTAEVNLAATRVLAGIAKGFQVQRFIFASTCSVYGASDFVLSERSVLNPVSLYATTKLHSEKVLLGFNDVDFSPTILRFATIYGLSARPRFDLVVNLLAGMAESEGRITIFGGEQWRPFVHVSDAARALVKCLEAPLVSVKGQIFNVGSDAQNYKICEIGEIIKECLPRIEVEIKEMDQDIRNYRVTFEKISRVMDFNVEKTVYDGVQEIVEAVRSGLISNWRDTRYSNTGVLADQDNLMVARGVKEETSLSFVSSSP